MHGLRCSISTDYWCQLMLNQPSLSLINVVMSLYSVIIIIAAIFCVYKLIVIIYYEPLQSSYRVTNYCNWWDMPFNYMYWNPTVMQPVLCHFRSSSSSITMFETKRVYETLGTRLLTFRKWAWALNYVQTLLEICIILLFLWLKS